MQSEYHIFVEEFKKNPGQIWIMKPVAKSQGKGIFLFRKLKDIMDWKKVKVLSSYDEGTVHYTKLYRLPFKLINMAVVPYHSQACIQGEVPGVLNPLKYKGINYLLRQNIHLNKNILIEFSYMCLINSMCYKHQIVVK